MAKQLEKRIAPPLKPVAREIAPPVNLSETPNSSPVAAPIALPPVQAEPVVDADCHKGFRIPTPPAEVAADFAALDAEAETRKAFTDAKLGEPYKPLASLSGAAAGVIGEPIATDVYQGMMLTPAERDTIFFFRRCEAEEQARQSSGAPVKLLSILICTMPGREAFLARLRRHLDLQVARYLDEVEILESPSEEADYPVGLKRNRLIRRARGKFVAFFDDDDLPKDDKNGPGYVASIVEAIKANPDVDCLGLRGIEVVMNGNRPEKKHPFEHSVHHRRWYMVGESFYRSPNHLCPIRREHALKVLFRPTMVREEDFMWSMDLLAAGLLKKEVMIPTPIYIYERRPKA
jgi:hypothetical protein